MSDQNMTYEELIIRHLDGHITDDESARLQLWLHASVANQNEFDQMEALYLLAGDVDLLDQIDVESDLVHVKSKLTRDASAVTRSFFSPMLRVAATILLLAAAAVTFYWTTIDHDNSLVALSDGTKVYLRDDARLDYPAIFDGDERRVTLIGEAFFEVSHNPSKPFIIDMLETQVEVLGTSFLIKQSSSQVDVMVQSGKVKFLSKLDAVENITLTANEHGTFDENKLSEKANENINYLSWHTGEFVFEGESLSDVLNELSGFYPELKLGSSAMDDCPLTANFNKEKLKTVIQTIEKSCGLKAKKSNGKWIFN